MPDAYDDSGSVVAPARRLAAVTPDDDNDLTDGTAKALYIGTSGNVAIIAADDSSSVTLASVPVGVLPVRAKRVLSTGTTASNIVALY